MKVIGFAKGVVKARKILAGHATKDIVAWVDADVVVPSNWLVRTTTSAWQILIAEEG